jgi:hypothetical protein
MGVTHIVLYEYCRTLMYVLEMLFRNSCFIDPVEAGRRNNA